VSTREGTGDGLTHWANRDRFELAVALPEPSPL